MPLMLLLLFINKYGLLHDSTINTLCFDFVVYATSTVYGSINLIFFFSFSSSPSSRSKTLITRSEIDKAHLADTKQMIVTEVTETENPAFQAELEEGISFP